MSVIDNYIWPQSFPDGVPPDNSHPANGHVFRAVRNLPPDANDFQSTREEFPNRTFTSETNNYRSYGVSLFNCIDTLREKIRRFPALQNRKIAQGDLISELGVISNANRKGHLTLWKCKDSCPQQHINLPVSR